MSKKMRLWLQLPEIMRAVNRWLVANQLTKIPLDHGAFGQKAWLSFEQASTIAHPDPDLCLSFVAGDGWVCVDVDNRHMTGLVADWARQQQSLQNYAEYSINNGVHVWYPPGTIIQMPPSIRGDIWSTYKAIICTGRKL